MDVCILLGNDFSEYLHRNSFSFATVMDLTQDREELTPSFTGHETVDKIIELVRDMGLQGCSLHARGNDSTVAEVIEFSRAFYDLKDLSEYSFDGYNITIYFSFCCNTFF